MHRVRLPEDERTVLDGIPVTTVPRTIFDLAVRGRRREVERAFHEAEVQRLTDRLSVPHLLERYPAHAGARLLREVLAVGTSGGATANDLEGAFADLIERHDLPRPRYNADLVIRGRHFKPDCIWDGPRVLVELDGQAVHGTNRAFQSDRERDRILVADGWRAVRVTWEQIANTPEAVIGDLRKLLSGPVPYSP